MEMRFYERNAVFMEINEDIELYMKVDHAWYRQEGSNFVRVTDMTDLLDSIKDNIIKELKEHCRNGG